MSEKHLEIPDDINAFPSRSTGVGGESCNESHGMSLRDYFATAALQGLLANNEPTPSDEEIAESGTKSVAEFFAGSAYMYADEMMKARKNAKSS